jgi:hypothetical protein
MPAFAGMTAKDRGNEDGKSQSQQDESQSASQVESGF